MIRVPSPAPLSMSRVPPRPAARVRMLARPWWPRAEIGIGSEASAVIGDFQAYGPISAGHRNGGVSSVGMARDVGQRLTGDRQQVGNHGERQVRRLIAPDVDLRCRITPQLIRKHVEAVHEAARVQQQGLQAEDEVPDVPDHVMQRVDGRVDAGCGFGRFFFDEVWHVVERERHCVDHLDDAVVQVAADAIALIHDREALDLLVEPRVLDRYSRMKGEGLDQRLVVRAEIGSALLVGQVQATDHVPLDRHWHAQEGVHGRVVGREAVALSVRRNLRNPV